MEIFLISWICVFALCLPTRPSIKILYINLIKTLLGTEDGGTVQEEGAEAKSGS